MVDHRPDTFFDILALTALSSIYLANLTGFMSCEGLSKPQAFTLPSLCPATAFTLPLLGLQGRQE